MLREEVQRQQKILMKTEEKLNKKREFIKEMCNIQEDITKIKLDKQEDNVNQELMAENAMLKMKMQEMESRLNS